MHVSRLAAVVAALLALAVAGCTSAQAPSQPPTSSQAGTQTSHNDADVTFAQQMIPHHTQAIMMAEIATTRAGSAEVRELAGKIKSAQQPEIDQMTGWLQVWGAEIPSTRGNGMGGMDHGMGNGSMPGMMSPEQMQQMGQASGAQFDRVFLQMMIEHHEGAIEMAQLEVKDGQNSDAKALAERIITDQQAEITQMRSLLQNT